MGEDDTVTIQDIRMELEANSGRNEGYYKKLIPSMKPALGVRVPDLRKLAKKIAKEDYETNILEQKEQQNE